MNKKNPKVDGFLRAAKKWQAEFTELRRIILDCPLDEDVKWRWPCYTLNGKNVVLIHGFKDFCAAMFFKGALLKDPKGILQHIGQNTQAGRWIKFTTVQEVKKLESTLRAYIDEAIEVEKTGLKVPKRKTADLAIPEELQRRLDELPALKAAFAALTPGRQRAYLFHFSSAKQSKTREARIEKWMPQILNGKGLDDESST